jgi:hypothetical protein
VTTIQLPLAGETVITHLYEKSPARLGYWLVVPFYFCLYIIFGKKQKDPLGKYAYLTEFGLATYD